MRFRRELHQKQSRQRSSYLFHQRRELSLVGIQKPPFFPASSQSGLIAKSRRGGRARLQGVSALPYSPFDFLNQTTLPRRPFPRQCPQAGPWPGLVRVPFFRRLAFSSKTREKTHFVKTSFNQKKINSYGERRRRRRKK